MGISLPDRQTQIFRILCIAILFSAAICYGIFTIHWPWMWDTQVMHYLVYLLQHGKVAYRDIYDINMPGSYLTERWAINIFGGGDLGWRFYEFTLLGSMTAAACIVAMPVDWLAGLFAGMTFSILHGIDGAAMATERDEVVTVLLMVGYAFLFLAARRSRPMLMIPFGLSFGMATLIKPTFAPAALVLLIFAYFAAQKRKESPVPYVLYGCGGLAIALGILLSFLLPDSLGPFFFILKKLLPFYSHLEPATWSYMLKNSLPPQFLFLIPVALALAVANKERANWELWAVRAGILLGGLSYFAQRKGYIYHRYSLMAFVLLWIGIEFARAMKEKGWLRTVGVLGMAVAVFIVLPPEVNLLRHDRNQSNPLADSLQADLLRLGGDSLQNRVQCLDLATGCYSALYRLGLMQSTGFMGDLQFFGPDDGDVVPYYRKLFWDQIHERPPKVIVLSSEWFGVRYSFDKLNAWPEFRDYLNSAYTIDVSRSFGSFDGNELAYRIYVLK